MTTRYMTCGHCNRQHRDIRLVYRLNPVNWHPSYLRMCQRCRNNNREWAPVDYNRGYQEPTRTGGRPW
jgi:hypothetical protein